jgi:hypothetical protein
LRNARGSASREADDNDDDNEDDDEYEYDGDDDDALKPTDRCVAWRRWRGGARCGRGAKQIAEAPAMHHSQSTAGDASHNDSDEEDEEDDDDDDDDDDEEEAGFWRREKGGEATKIWRDNQRRHGNTVTSVGTTDSSRVENTGRTAHPATAAALSSPSSRCRCR